MSSEPLKLRILMLHGFTQSGPLFQIKTKALLKLLHKAFPPAPAPGHLKSHPGGVELIYPTAPMKLSPEDVPSLIADSTEDGNGGLRDEAYGWWTRENDSEPYQYRGLDNGLAAIAAVLREEGPFDGVVGFSQGGCAAGMVTALLEDGRKEAFNRHYAAQGGYCFPESFLGEEKGSTVHPAFKFAVSYSGFGASRMQQYRAFYEPKIVTPMMHFIGSVDTVVSEERSLQLVNDCVGGEEAGNGGRVVRHPGGHFLPTSKTSVVPLVAFIREVMNGQAGSENSHGGAEKEEESVEDMDVPF